MLVAPARAILGDVRWAHLLALDAAAVLIVLTAGWRGGWAAALLLLTPRALLVIQAAWIDPIVILMLALTLYCAIRKPGMLWLALGLLLASKQYMVLIVPLVHLLERPARKLLLRAFGVAVVINLPFLLWNPATTSSHRRSKLRKN
jgi:uncharacterized membrane protein